MFSIALSFVAVFLTSWLIYSNVRRPYGFPPGPKGILGFLELSKQNEPFVSKAIVKLAKQYGSVIGAQFFMRKFVLVSGYEAVSELLNNPVLDGRPESFDFNLRTYGCRKGILMTDGQLWKSQRRFTVRHLKDLGFGKTKLEHFMTEEINDLLQQVSEMISSSGNGNILLDDLFTTPVINVLWAIVTGKRFQRGDPKMDLLTASMNGFIRFSNGGPNLLGLFPFLRFIAPEFTGYNRLLGYIKPIRDYIQDVVAEHRKSRNADDPRDFIDDYLEMIDNQGDPDFSDIQLLGIVFDMFVAGSETTSHTLGFGLLLMVLHQDVQSKVQDEIDLVLHGSFPTLADRGRLPYTEATILEIQRLGIVAPITVPHVAMAETHLKGYFVPKGTITFVNLWSVHMDPVAWPEPDSFKPERHLDKDGNVFKSDHLVTFGQGKRSCIGETLAKNSLFLFFTSMMQNYRFELPCDPSSISESLIPNMEPIPGLTLAPRPCLARVTKRIK